MKTPLQLGMLITLLTGVAFAQSTTWEYSTKKNLEGKTSDSAIALSNDSASLVIRCQNACEVYVALDDTIAADQASVRVKFNDGPLRTFAVNRGEGSDSLFFKAPMSIIKAIRDNGGYMKVEYRPYERTATVATFGVCNYHDLC
jgi:hypothetical protein